MPAKGPSPTQRTLRALRNEGVLAGVVEKFNQHVGPHGVRQDLFGFIDLIAATPERGIVGVQCCARSGHAAHKRKILQNEVAPEWLKSGGGIEIWSWAKQKVKRGGKLERWMPKVEQLSLEDFDESSN